eukprot:gene2980-3721_t
MNDTTMRYMQDYNFKEKKALIRVDFNVPLTSDGAIADPTRIDKALPTIMKILADGGSAVLLSHFGRPKRGDTTNFSLKHLVPYLNQCLGRSVHFAADCIGEEVEAQVRQLPYGEVLLLENVRFHEAEEQGEANFSQALARLGDVYVNDAFGAIHREHASTYGILRYMQDKVAGLLLQQEIENADQLLSKAAPPFTAIIGGTKIQDKIQTILALLDKVGYLLIGGGVANTFHQALGGALGSSVVETQQHERALTILHQAIEKNVELILPTDVIIADRWGNGAKMDQSTNDQVPNGWMALDIGPHTQSMFANIIKKSRTLLWAGPVGAFELEAYRGGSRAILQAVAEATQQGAFSLIGGGDSATAVAQLGYGDKVSYVSTGGGALLAYLANPHLPVINALRG